MAFTEQRKRIPGGRHHELGVPGDRLHTTTAVRLHREQQHGRGSETQDSEGHEDNRSRHEAPPGVVLHNACGPRKFRVRDVIGPLKDVVAGSEPIFPLRRLAGDGLEAWKQILARGY